MFDTLKIGDLIENFFRFRCGGCNLGILPNYNKIKKYFFMLSIDYLIIIDEFLSGQFAT